MAYGLYGKLVTQAGKRDAVTEILLRDVNELKSVGCKLYIVNHAAEEPDAIWVTEVWDSAESHAASLQLPTVKAAIAEAMPMLTGEFDQVKLDVVGGLGLF
ncbi:MAG: antibiotic biosynthesis monooxygenase [Chloroflexota bacterium]